MSVKVAITDIKWKLKHQVLNVSIHPKSFSLDVEFVRNVRNKNSSHNIKLNFTTVLVTFPMYAPITKSIQLLTISLKNRQRIQLFNR
jgi:hypothetical protein